MKKAFTMIELIFVIVILGILAAVAIPKLNATRDDAELAKANTNLTTLIGDITSYYTSKGTLPTSNNPQDLTGVALYHNKNCEPARAGGAAWMKVNNTCECLLLKFGTNSNGEAFYSFSAKKGAGDKDSTCQKFIDNISNSGIFGNGYTYHDFKIPKSTLDNSDTYFRLGGSGVLW
ncbi:type II secretion system protein [Campylobacter sp. RM12651]|uniref:type II secretion system protein n=1 Tax=Campylobacter sp. RM12651 TaxID=1660079 RepID=UPI001EFA5F52|nr:type II secretion system protein [Campylobacter sp. RM12651]ULO04292.1 putative type II secretion system protein [Campylobacter sp. RM12651]